MDDVLITVEDLNPTTSPARGQAIPTMKDGVSSRLSVDQLLGLLNAADVASAGNGASDKAAPADTDKFFILDSAASWVLKKLTWLAIKLGVFVHAAAVVASAATADIGSAASLFVSLTGTTAITSLGNAAGIQVGTLRLVQFAGALTLTNNANIILPTGANITTAANDVMLARYEGGGIWRVLWYRGALATADWTAGTSTKPGMPTPAQIAAVVAASVKAVVVSAQLTPSLAGTLTFAHGLGRVPDRYWASYVCTTADGGYAVGDEIAPSQVFNTLAGSSSTASAGITLRADATSVYAIVGSGGIGQILNKSTGVVGNMSASSWKVRLWAN